MTNAISQVQILRGIAAWMVVYHHYVQMYYQFEVSNPVAWFFLKRGSFGVEIFFVISGFIMAVSTRRREQSAQDFFARRIARIVPVYWFFTTLSLLVFSLSHHYLPWRNFLLSLFFIPHQHPTLDGLYPLLPVGWSLNYEMFFYLVLTLGLTISARHSLGWIAMIFILGPFYWPETWIANYFMSSYLILEFAFGIFIGMAWTRLEGFKPKSNYFAMFLLGIGLVFMLQDYLPPVPLIWRFTLISDQLAAVLVLLSVLFLDFKANGLTGFLEKAGDCSYSTYLIHVFVIRAFRDLFGRPGGWLYELTTITAISIVIYVLSIYSARYIENGRIHDACWNFLRAKRKSTAPQRTS